MTTHEEYIAARKKRRESFETSVATTLKDHQYTALVDAPDVEVWRCKAPGRTAYAFDITITRFGIGVMGDIDSLVFSVGSSYGLEFLAGNDVEYYIHSKLEQRFKDRDLDEQDFRGCIISGVCELLVDEAADDEAYEALPAWVREESERGPTGSRWDDLRDLIFKKDEAEDSEIDWADVHRRLSDASLIIGSVEEANSFRSDHHELLGLGDDWWDYDISKPSDGLIERLYMVRHAARQILAQKQEAAQPAAAQ